MKLNPYFADLFKQDPRVARAIALQEQASDGSPTDGLGAFARGLKGLIAGQDNRLLEKEYGDRQKTRANEIAKLFGTQGISLPEMGGDTEDVQLQFALQSIKDRKEAESEASKAAREDKNWEREAALKRELAAMRATASGGSMVIDPDTGEMVYSPPAPKPMPAAALKMQQEALDAIGTAENSKKDLASYRGMIEGDKLNLGLVENAWSATRNFFGNSSENSRNYSSFKSALEKLRNDSLRLNKGVQTEGDAVRAWNELLANINDEKNVINRLSEIETINARAADLQRLNVDAIRSNYKQPEIDTTGYQGQPAYPTSGAPAQPAQQYQEGQTAIGPNGQALVFTGGKWRKK